jgi:hypothetical protein
LDAKAVPKIVDEVLKPCDSQVFFPSTGIFPLEDKNRLTLWGQADAEKCVLKIKAGKKLCLIWDKA